MEHEQFITVDHPKILIPSKVNKINTYNLRNDDIEGTKSQFPISKRSTNPLSPNYILPSVKIKPFTSFTNNNKPVRDIMKVDDIVDERNPLECKDINNPNEEFKPKIPRRLNPNENIDKINVKDINSQWIFKTKRETNPLSPKYFGYEKNFVIGEIEGNKPMILPKINYNKEEIKDQRKHKEHHLPENFPVNRREYRKINYIDDIGQGVHPTKNYATFHVPSKRSTLPLDPIY
ncbi:hypothetical protein ABK040_016148 [Willaertia magna]